MIYVKPAIFLGDLVRAIRTLQPADDKTRHAIAELLGLQQKEPYLAQVEEVTPTALDRVLLQDSQDRPSSTVEIDKPAQSLGPTTPFLPSTLESIPSEIGEWSISVEPLPRATSQEFENPLLLEPLFVPGWVRNILAAALATTSGEGPLDVERIVNFLSQGKHIQQLPKSVWPTLRRGVQVLVDKSEAMMPFARDQFWLQKEIRRVVGEDRVVLLRFAGCPLWGVGTGPKASWSDYRPPLPGTPVLLLADLGIGRPMLAADSASVSEWLDFANVVRRAGCPLIALVPYPPFRWPSRLTRAMIILQWDRQTTTTSVHNQVGRAHKVVE